MQGSCYLMPHNLQLGAQSCSQEGGGGGSLRSELSQAIYDRSLANFSLMVPIKPEKQSRNGT